MKTIKSITEKDYALLEPFILEDGGVPPMFLFHFESKVNPAITTMMNQLKSGFLNVEDGFYISLNDEKLMENRERTIENFAIVFAVLTLMKVLPKISAVVFIAEAEARVITLNLNTRKGKVVPDKQNDIFTTFGLDSKGKGHHIMKTKLITLKTVKGEPTTSIVLENYEEELFIKKAKHIKSAPVLKAFWKKYDETIEKVANDKKHIEFIREAKRNPLQTFKAALEASFTVSQLG